MARNIFLILSLIFGVSVCFAQKQPIDRYVKDTGDFNEVASVVPGARTVDQINNILPLRKPSSFAEYVAAKTSAVDIFTLEQAVDKARMNKQIGSPSGPSGITSLVSNASAPAVLGLGEEYGSILQKTTGNTTTLRANLLGVSRMLLGADQFPYCSLSDQKNCEPASRWLRRFSGVGTFENTNSTTTTANAMTTTSTIPTVVDLFSNGFRMASWGARFDITANDPSDPAFLKNFKDAIDTLRGKNTPGDLAKAVEDLFADATIQPIYQEWAIETQVILQQATKSELKKKLADQLDSLIDKLMAASPDFVRKVAAVRRTSQNYFTERDSLLQDIQSHRFSVEYTNLHGQNQPSTSNVRVIYSHQPSAAPLLITFNTAFTWYNSLPAGATVGRLRDVQAAGKLDRRLGVIPTLGNAVLTFGGYYQWMKEDALITIGPGNVAPGSGIVLPGTAATLLKTKGNIGIVQGRLTLPINNTIKVPLSITWSNRTELVKESDTRGQVGVTFDIDNLFK